MSGSTILVVDDERNIVQLARLYLRNEGYQVETAANGREALEKVRQTSPSLILLDLMMPEMDGWEVCKQLRKTSDVPIIMLTARDDDIDKVVGLELGADDYVTKPFNPRELVARVKAVLRRTERGSEPTRVIRFAGSDHRPGPPRVPDRRAAGRPAPEGVRPAVDARRQSRRRVRPRAAAAGRLGLRLRRRLANGGRPRHLAAREAARPARRASRPSGALATSSFPPINFHRGPPVAVTRPRPDAQAGRPRASTRARSLAAPAVVDEQPTNRMPASRRERPASTTWLDSLRPAHSLRARLILAFAAIIFLTLLLVGIGFVFIIRQYQEQRELLRLGTVIGPILGQARQLDQQGRTLEEARDFLDRQADELDVRLVLARGRRHDRVRQRRHAAEPSHRHAGRRAASGRSNVRGWSWRRAWKIRACASSSSSAPAGDRAGPASAGSVECHAAADRARAADRAAACCGRWRRAWCWRRWCRSQPRSWWPGCWRPQSRARWRG